MKKKIQLEDVLIAVKGNSKDIENLAVSTKNGFDSVEKKADDRFKIVVDEFDRIRSDIRDIKTTLGPLVRVVAQQEKEMTDMLMRLNRVERKVGIENKVI